MVVPSLPTKSELRKDALLLRQSYAQALWPETRRSLEAQLAEIVLPHLLTARIIAAYHPLRDEISPYPIIEGLGHGQRVAFPWFAGRDSRMIWREGPVMETSPWGVLQPGGDAEALAPDLVLVPLVKGDRTGMRIGHGKGHYDRALSHLREAGGPVFTIGLAWEPQISDEPLPRDPWDISLDAIATPKEWISCR
jgi:5-formyltetrahydrofolate cyclo-ligase